MAIAVAARRVESFFMSLLPSFVLVLVFFLTQNAIAPVKAGWNDIWSGIATSDHNKLSNWKILLHATSGLLYTTFSLPMERPGFTDRCGVESIVRSATGHGRCPCAGVLAAEPVA